MKKTINIIDYGSLDTFYTKDDGAVFGIAFDKIFEKEGLDTFNSFILTSKRYCKNLAVSIAQTYEEIFTDEGGKINNETILILFKILNAKSIIMSTKNFQYNKFIELLDDVMSAGDNLFSKTISKYVAENMVENMDKTTEEMREKKRKINKELQMTDAHGRDIVKLAYAYRLLIPLISEYFFYNKTSLTQPVSDDEDDVEYGELCSTIFSHIFDTIIDRPDALRNKIYRIVESRISKTTFSDKKFWDMLKKVAITKDTEALKIYKKVLVNAIPKIMISDNMNIVGFLQAVIHNQVDFLFQVKFKHKLVVIEGNDVNKTSTEDNDDDNSDFEHVEFLNIRKNEGSHIIRKLNVADTVTTIPEKLGVFVEDAEVKEIVKTLKRNSIQEQIVSMVVLKYFDDPQAIKYLNFYDYAFLVLACKKFLTAHKFIYLPMILTAVCEKHKERVNICGKKVRPEIMRSKKYTELFQMKYRDFSSLVDAPFLSAIGTTYSSEFRNELGEDLFDGSVKVPKIAEEMIDLAYLV